MSTGLAKRVGARVLIASTSEVYGDPEVHPQPETYWGHVNPIGKITCYNIILLLHNYVFIYLNEQTNFIAIS
jgi:nucleoside-diphosphate-sugar epimerase